MIWKRKKEIDITRRRYISHGWIPSSWTAALTNKSACKILLRHLKSKLVNNNIFPIFEAFQMFCTPIRSMYIPVTEYTLIQHQRSKKGVERLRTFYNWCEEESSKLLGCFMRRSESCQPVVQTVTRAHSSPPQRQERHLFKRFHRYWATGAKGALSPLLQSQWAIPLQATAQERSAE